MNTEILGVILQWVALVVLCYPLGRYIAKVYRGERTWLDFMAPLERGIYKVCGIREDEEMDWKQFLKALLMVNLFWFFWGMLLLVFQGYLPMNPDGNPGQTPDLAFNTCISFMVNCNLQHYSGESGLSYFTQIFVIMLFQFITAACGMAAMAGIMKALAAKTTKTIGNFWVYLVKSTTRILMPLSLLVGILLVINGTPMSFDGKQTLTTLEGQEQVISQGPTAAIVPIKQLGTNGGGYFGTNSAHPLENPNAFTNMLECWSILIIPMAMAFSVPVSSGTMPRGPIMPDGWTEALRTGPLGTAPTTAAERVGAGAGTAAPISSSALRRSGSPGPKSSNHPLSVSLTAKSGSMPAGSTVRISALYP